MSPDLLDLHVPSSGSAQTQIPIPDTTTLAGAVFYQQVVPVEFGAAGLITAITSTNRLVMVIGSF